MNDIITEKAEPSEVKRGEGGRFIVPPKSPGPPKLTEEQKLARRVQKKVVEKYVKEYEAGLAEQLPELSPKLVASARRGNMQAFDQIHKIVGAYKKEGGGTIIPIQVNINEERDKYA